MKICFVCCEYAPGSCGCEGVVTRTLSRGLLGAGDGVRVAGIYPRGDGAPDSGEVDGVWVRRIRIPGGPLGWVRARFALYRHIRDAAVRGDIDLVEVPLSRGLAAHWGALPVPVIVRVHGSRILEDSACGKPRDPVAYWFERRCLRRADFRCAVSRGVADAVAARFAAEVPDDFRVLHNPVEIPESCTSPPGRSEAPTVVFAGTLKATKGVDLLVRAWPRVRSEVPEARLEIYGRDAEGPYGGSMALWIRQALRDPESAGVRLHGHVPREDLLRAFAVARVAVFPSRMESFGMVVAEAMAMGCATVFVRSWSGPELIADGTDGVLIEPESPDAIAQALIGLLRDPARAAALGTAAAAKIPELFSLPRIVAQNRAFYGECLERFAASSPMSGAAGLRG